jgi:hypothetical protein
MHSFGAWGRATTTPTAPQDNTSVLFARPFQHVGHARSRTCATLPQPPAQLRAWGKGTLNTLKSNSRRQASAKGGVTSIRRHTRKKQACTRSDTSNSLIKHVKGVRQTNKAVGEGGTRGEEGWGEGEQHTSFLRSLLSVVSRRTRWDGEKKRVGKPSYYSNRF